jgi:hypothetical protein
VGLQLPGELVSLLGELGFTWPEADEEKLVELGSAWLDFGAGLAAPLGQAGSGAQQVWSGNEGSAIASFQQAWTESDSPASNLDDAVTAATMVGAGLMVCAGIVLALKINVIIQLTMLAMEIIEAIATAAPTFGASLLEVPIFKEITQLLIDQLLNLAIDAVLGG